MIEKFHIGEILLHGLVSSRIFIKALLIIIAYCKDANKLLHNLLPHFPILRFKAGDDLADQFFNFLVGECAIR